MEGKSVMFLIYRFLRRRVLYFYGKNSQLVRSKSSLRSTPGVLPPTTNSENKSLVFDFEGSLLMSPSTFPYFMLVALEAGGFLRGFLLLLMYPLVWFLGEDEEMGIKVMAFFTFCGLRTDGLRVGRAVLPKHFLDTMGMEGAEVVLREWKRRVGVTSMPAVMVEPFLKEYMGVETVVGRKMKVSSGFYTGIMEDNNNKIGEEEEEEEKEKELFGSGEVLGFTGISTTKTPFFSKCKEVYTLSEANKRNWHVFPKQRSPKPLMFHDGRIAFLPTRAATLAMFIWLPFGISLAIIRAVVCLTLPYKISIPISSFLGMKYRSDNYAKYSSTAKNSLFVCNHRTLLDPIYVSGAIGKEVTAVTYSVSRVSEILAPIKTVRLTRKREEDKRRMDAHLKQGHLVVCPEGTTCREPFLLRFSPLFTELTDEVVPVALDVTVSMFYGTTAAGLKAFDPLFFLMNPFPTYEMQFLEKIETLSAIEKSSSGKSYEIANLVQKALGEALGFTCTALTRKDKYLMLAGNEGVVGENK